MKSNNLFKLFLLYSFLFTVIPALNSSLYAAPGDTLHKNEPYHRIVEERFIPINGIEQWVTIKGESSKPVILFLHGGPGSPLSPYADSIYSKWEKDFLLVQWDQRGTGKTFGHTAPAELSPDYLKSNPLTVEQMTEDGIDLVEYLLKYLGKQKIILFGTSWGSVLGVRMAVTRPELFYAYIGHSQIVNPSNNLDYDYQKVYKMAATANDRQSLNVLDSIGRPPYDIAKNSGKLLRIIKKYERQNSLPAPASWFKMAALYDNEKDGQHRDDGDDYSFVNYVGDKRFGIKPMISTINLLKDSWNFKIPVFLLQGEEDILTPKEITNEYFKKIRAPQKKIILLPKTAHGFNLPVVEMQYKIIEEYIMPLIKRQKISH